MNYYSMSLSIDSLPNEILDSVLVQLACPDLASISLVSHAWQVLAFPHLYCTVSFYLGAHLDHFCERVASDDGTGPVSICANVKGLVLRHKYGLAHIHEIIADLNIKNLALVIHRLVHLRHLCWELYFIPANPQIMLSFHAQCPKLDSVNLWFGQDYDYYYSRKFPVR